MSLPIFPLLMAVLAGVCWAVLGLCYRWAAARGCRPGPFAFCFLLVGGLLGLAKTVTEPTQWDIPLLWGMAAAIGVIIFALLPLYTSMNSLGPVSINWTIVNLSLLLPIAASAIFFHEALHPVDLLLLLVFIAMLFAFARSMATSAETPPERLNIYALGMIAVFLLNGLSLFGMKAKAVFLGEANSAAFVTILHLTGAALLLVVILIRERGALVRRAEWQVGALAGLCGASGNLFMLAAVSGLPSAVVYPLGQGISLLGGAILAILVTRERLNLPKAIGLTLGIAVLVLASARPALIEWWMRMLGR